MSPFAVFLKNLRLRRGLPQKVAAARLGCKPSYLCSLETGQKKVPRGQFLEKVISAYQLNRDEACELTEVANLSAGAIRMPDLARPEEYAICQKLQEHLGHLTKTQIQLIEIALDLREVAESSLSNLPLKRSREEEAQM